MTETMADSVFTLEQCKQMALASNAEIRTADNNVRAAKETGKEAFTKYFPEISASASAFRTNHDMIQYTVLDLFTLGIIDKGKAAGIWALQPVFMGGQIVNGNKLAKGGGEAARIRKEQTADQVQLQTEALYWQLVTLKATKHTLESAITTLDTLGLQVKTAVDVGVATMNDYLKVELKRNSYRADLVDLENGIELMKMLLAQQIGLGPTKNIDVTSEVPDSVPAYPKELYVNPADALRLTNDHQLLVKNVEAKNLERKMEIGQNLPKVAVGAGWFYHNGFNQNHIGLGYLSQKLEIEMSDKWDNLTAAHRKMMIAREAITQSEENLRLNKAYYEAGMSTITDLLDAQALDRQAKDDYISAYGLFKLSEAQYLDSTGRNNL